MDQERQKVAILGATGSIGQSALRGLSQYPQYFQIVALSAHSNQRELERLAHTHGVTHLCLTSRDGRPTGTYHWYQGAEGLLEMIWECGADIILNGIAGSAGLRPSFEVIASQKHLALANKESIVMAGRLLIDFARQKEVHLIPVDSEHAALDALVETHGIDNISQLILTASGGPFLNRALSEFPSITASEAVNHPTWRMGPKISIDSATMANKGLEVIEAAYLFDVPEEAIEVTIHPQSIIHALVRMIDGSLFAQLSQPDMIQPIMRALSGKVFLNELVEPLVFDNLSLTFSQVEAARFPLLDLARQALRQGEAAAIAYNAANEMAVDAFIKQRITFVEIAQVVSHILDSFRWSYDCANLEEVFAFDREARTRAQEYIAILS